MPAPCVFRGHSSCECSICAVGANCGATGISSAPGRRSWAVSGASRAAPCSGMRSRKALGSRSRRELVDVRSCCGVPSADR